MEIISVKVAMELSLTKFELELVLNEGHMFIETAIKEYIERNY